MRPELEHIYQIDMYLKGALTPEEINVFEQRLATDNDFFREVELQRTVNEVVIGSAYGRLREQMAHDIKIIDDKANIRKKYFSLAAIGSLTIICFLLWFSSIPSKKVSTQPVRKKATERIDPLVTVPSIANSEVGQAKDIPVLVPKKPISPLKHDAPSIVYKDQSGQAETLHLKHEIDTFSAKLHLRETSIPESLSENKINSSEDLTPENVNCTNISIHAKPLIEPSCREKNDGRIEFKNAIYGGKEPYIIGLEREKNGSYKDAFIHLSPGEYHFLIKDASGCSTSLSITVPEKICTVHKNTVNTQLNEYWEVPAIRQVYTLVIYNRAGQERFRMKSDNLHLNQWNGTDIQGNPLDPGLYVYILEYEDGKKDHGQISIIK